MSDLVDVIEIASISDRTVQEGAHILEQVVREVSGYVRKRLDGPILQKFADILKQEQNEQTVRMAMAILTNAFVFHHYYRGDLGCS